MYPIKQILEMDWQIVTISTTIEEYGYDELLCAEPVETSIFCIDPMDLLADLAGEICAGEVEYISSRPATFNEVMGLYDLACRVGEILYWRYRPGDPYRPEVYGEFEELPF